jgi:PncC family amidohydrolase
MSENLARRTGELLIQRGWTIGVGESCTGGLLGHIITNIPGSSVYFKGGVIAYANDVKRDLLGVAPETLETYGAVSEQSAVEMAIGARTNTGADVGVSITGIAGPDGGTEAKPVGLTWIGVSTVAEDRAERYIWEGDRDTIKERSAHAALELVNQILEEAG